MSTSRGLPLTLSGLLLFLVAACGEVSPVRDAATDGASSVQVDSGGLPPNDATSNLDGEAAPVEAGASPGDAKAAPREGSTHTSDGPLVKPTGAKFDPGNGVYIGGGTYDGEWPEFVTNCKKQPALRLTFVYFPSDVFDNRPTHKEQSLSQMDQAGVTPVVTWQPQTYVADIAAGKYDAYVKARAQECKKFGKPMFIRYAHEANGGWYPWQKDPASVKKSSQRIYDIFKQEGATNVAFVWCPAFDSSGKKLWLNYYPGDAWVDWVGIDVYNWARWPRTFDQMVKDLYPVYANVKPIMIGEVGSAENFNPDPGFANPAAQNKAKWITDMFNDMNTKYPQIKAFVWFNVVKEDNWKINSSPATLAAFQAGVANSRYLSKVVP